MDMFAACIKWSREKCEQHESDGANSANLAALCDAINKNRFMTAEVFAKIFTEKNSKLRVSAIVSGIRKQSHLECPLCSGARIAIDPTIDNNVCIGFSCNKPIKLCGIVLCNVFSGDFDVFIFILQKAMHSKLCSNDECKILFEGRPIRVIANEWCSINIIRKNFAFEPFSGSDLYGFHSESKIERNGVQFYFISQNYQKVNIIMRLLFNFIDESC